MKALTAALLIAAATANAQDIPANRPDGASGPGVQFTQRVVGTIISVGSPITKPINVGYDCPDPTKPKPHSVVNKGTIIGAITGAAAGYVISDKNGVATVAGAAAGGAIGNNIDKRSYEKRTSAADSNGCVTVFEMRTVGWNYTATYAGLQMQGVMVRQPNVGEDVMIIITSTFYAGE